MPTIKEQINAGITQFNTTKGIRLCDARLVIGVDNIERITLSQGLRMSDKDWFFNLDGKEIIRDKWDATIGDLINTNPKPLPNQSERIATLEAALNEATDLIEKLHYEHLLGMSWLEDEEARFRAIAGGQDND